MTQKAVVRSRVAIVALNKQSSAEQAIEELRNMSAIDPANLIIADVITNAHQYIVNDAEMCKEMITDEIKVSQQEWAKLRTCGPQIITDILASIAATNTIDASACSWKSVRRALALFRTFWRKFGECTFA